MVGAKKCPYTYATSPPAGEAAVLQICTCKLIWGGWNTCRYGVFNLFPFMTVYYFVVTIHNLSCGMFVFFALLVKQFSSLA